MSQLPPTNGEAKTGVEALVCGCRLGFEWITEIVELNGVVGLPSSILSGFLGIDTGDVGAEFGKITLVL